MAKQSGQGESLKVRKLEVIKMDELSDVAKMDYYIDKLKSHIVDYINCNDDSYELLSMYQKINELEAWWLAWYELE